MRTRGPESELKGFRCQKYLRLRPTCNYVHSAVVLDIFFGVIRSRGSRQAPAAFYVTVYLSIGSLQVGCELTQGQELFLQAMY